MELTGRGQDRRPKMMIFFSNMQTLITLIHDVGSGPKGTFSVPSLAALLCFFFFFLTSFSIFRVSLTLTLTLAVHNLTTDRFVR